MRDKNAYRKAYQDAVGTISVLLDEKEKLEEKLHAIEYEISDYTEAARTLGIILNVDVVKDHPELFPEETEPEKGFTDAVRDVFHKADDDQFWEPIAVRDQLKENGFPLTKYKNPLASIHTILRRLVKQGELGKYDLGDEGIFRYRLYKKPDEPAE